MHTAYTCILLQGPKGYRGPDGPRGYDGDPGKDGLYGLKGNDGDIGHPGPRGLQGQCFRRFELPGAAGEKGHKGVKVCTYTIIYAHIKSLCLQFVGSKGSCRTTRPKRLQRTKGS